MTYASLIRSEDVSGRKYGQGFYPGFHRRKICIIGTGEEGSCSVVFLRSQLRADLYKLYGGHEWEIRCFTKRNISLIHVNPSSVEEHRGWIKHTDSLYEHVCDENQIISKEFDCIITKAKNEKIIGKTNRAFFLIDENMRLSDNLSGKVFFSSEIS